MGIIGRNGAGKSTLLKILSRITEPSAGQVDIYGRIGSLLEVGTGFHPELTGRENIFLNGAILGMQKREIENKFNEIVEFAEIDKFIDTPVKHYSSGMYTRLAFAVAAHLDPQILIIDEVLAVGDISFQKKCINRMESVAGQGKTVLFVSHNLDAINKICENAILLHEGFVLTTGSTIKVIEAYYDLMKNYSSNNVSFQSHHAKDIESIKVYVNGKSVTSYSVWNQMNPLKIDIEIRSKTSGTCPVIDLAFYTLNGIKLFAVQSNEFIARQFQPNAKKWIFHFSFHSLELCDQNIYFDLGIRSDYASPYLNIWSRVAEIVVYGNNKIKGITNDSIINPHVSVQVE